MRVKRLLFHQRGGNFSQAEFDVMRQAFDVEKVKTVGPHEVVCLCQEKNRV